MNLTVLKGNICKDIDLKYVSDGKMAIAKFSLAVSRMKKDDPSDFFNCTAFNKTAELIAENLGKGSPILINGHLQTGSYTNKADVKVYTTDVIVDRFEFIGKKEDASTNENKTTSYDIDGATPIDDGDIPF